MAILSIKSAGWLHGPGRTVWLGGAIRNFMAWVADGAANTFTVDNLTKITKLTRTDWQGTVALSASARTNRALNSENASLWSKYTGVTVTPNAATGPRGDATADKITYDGTGTADSYRIYTDAGGSYKPASGQPAVGTLWMRADSNVTVRLYNNLPPYKLTTCNLTTAWQRFRTPVGSVGNGASALQLLIYSASGDNAPWSIYVDHAQLEDGADPTAYIGPTTTAPVTVTDYALASEEVTLGETPVSGAVLTLDGDITADVEGA